MKTGNLKKAKNERSITCLFYIFGKTTLSDCKILLVVARWLTCRHIPGSAVSLIQQTWVSYSGVILCTYEFQMFRVDLVDYMCNHENKDMIVEIRTWHVGAQDHATVAGEMCGAAIERQLANSDWAS